MFEARLKQHCDAVGLPSPPPLVPTRRAFLLGLTSSLFTLEAVGAERPRFKVDQDFWKRPRELWLKRAENGEQVQVVYWANGEYRPEEYTKLCWLLRDLHVGKAVQMDTTLLNVLAGVQGYYRAYGLKGPLIVTSGYRTPETNARLAREGAARNSMHLYGRAADITLPGVPVEHLGRVNQYLYAGGVGFYPSKHFVHVDTGRPRTWRG